VGGTLVAVHFRDERGFAILSLEQPDGSRIRALGYLPPDVTLRAVVRVGGTWTRHAQYGWQVQVKTVELVDHLGRRGLSGGLHHASGPVHAADAVERFGDRVFEVICANPEELCAIKGIAASRARAVHESFAQVATIANVDSWLRHIGLGKADARRVREAYGKDAARLVRENPYRVADDVHGVGFVTADSLRLMLGIAPTSTFRLHAALKYVLGLVARCEGHVYCRAESWRIARCDSWMSGALAPGAGGGPGASERHPYLRAAVCADRGRPAGGGSVWRPRSG